MSARRNVIQAALREWITYDTPLRALAGEAAWLATQPALRSGDRRRQAGAFQRLMRLHSGGFSASLDARIVQCIAHAAASERTGTATGLHALYDETVRGAVRRFLAGPKPDPRRLIGSRILVVKTARTRERGVIVVDYSYVFALMEGLFDLPRIAERYAIVLEPSWAGTCVPEILLFGRLGPPTFVETIEPRDRALLAHIDPHLLPVPIAANWWVDHRLAPAVGAPRDIDVAMVASWSNIKRHWRVFRALADLRRRGHRLKVALVGYQHDRTKSDVEALARYFGIGDQVEAYERITQDEVSRLLARSKVHVLWSRRECANRAIVEAMLADVPVIVREGLTFGFPYPYINEQTGRFVKEGDLADAILETIATRDRYAPRSWVLEHMTAEQATAILEREIRTCATAAGESWSEGLVVKTSTLDTQRYWTPGDRQRFESDYAFIERALRPAPGPS